MLFISDRDAFSMPRFVKDSIIASLAFAYSLWTIAGSGYQVVFRGFMLLLAGIPVYVFMKWRARDGRRGRDALTVPSDLPETSAPVAVPEPVTVG